MTEPTVELRWRRREPPLAVAGVLVEGTIAAAFVRQLLANDIDPLLRVCADREWLLALGPAAALPWVDGAIWLGRVGALLMPTIMQPELPANLIARRLAADAPTSSVLVATPTAAITSTLPATSPTTATLEAWLKVQATP